MIIRRDSIVLVSHTHTQKVVVVVAESFHKFTQKTLQLGDLSECDVVGIWLNPNVYITICRFVFGCWYYYVMHTDIYVVHIFWDEGLNALQHSGWRDVNVRSVPVRLTYNTWFDFVCLFWYDASLIQDCCDRYILCVNLLFAIAIERERYKVQEQEE